MSNNLSKLLVPSRINLLVERAFRGHEFLEGPVFHDVPGVEVDDVVVVFSCFYSSAAGFRAVLYRTFDLISSRGVFKR